MNPTDTAEVPVKSNEPEGRKVEGGIPKEEPRGLFRSLKERAFGSSKNIFNSFSTIRQENPTVDLTSEQNELDALSSQLQQETATAEKVLGGIIPEKPEVEGASTTVASETEKPEAVKEAHQIAREIVDFFNNWDEKKAESVEGVDGLDLFEATERLNESQRALLRINVLGREWSTSSNSSHYQRVSEYYSLDEVIADAKANFADKKSLLEASASIPVLDAHITDLALKATGSNSVQELTEKGKVIKNARSLFRDVDSNDSDLLWQIIEPHVRKVLGDHPNFADKTGMGDVATVWDEYTIAPKTSERISILEEVIEKASISERMHLVEVAQTEIAHLLSGELRYLPSNNEGQNEENNKYRAMVDVGGRKELLKSALALAKSLDSLSSTDSNITEVAQTIGVDSTELVSVVGDYYNGDFTKKIMTRSLEVPFAQQPEILKKYVAEYFSNPQFVGRNLRTYINDARELGINSDVALSALSAGLKEDGTIAQLIPGEIRAMDVASDNPNILAGFEKNDFNMERLVSKIVQADSSDSLAKRFDKLLGDNDEMGLVWEYFKLDGANQAERFFQMTPTEHVPVLGSNIPGFPDNLQWSKMRQADRERFTSDRSFDGLESIPVNKLSPEGQAILIKTIVREVLSRSQSPESKIQAEGRNILQANAGQAVLHSGDLLHGTNIKYLQAILHGGDRAGEFLGFDESRDMTPVGADFSMILPTDETGEFNYEKDAPFDTQALRDAYKDNPFKAIYYASIAAQYGAREEDAFTSRGADSTANTSVTLIFGRNREDAFLKGVEYQGHMREHHKLIPVGLPSTEVSGLIINGQAQETIEKAKADIVKNGFYIPIYDIEGTLLFTPEEYKSKNSEKSATSENIAA